MIKISKKQHSQTLYLLTHTPTHIGRPVQMGFVGKAEWSNKLFELYRQDVELSCKTGHPYSFLSKKDIERWGFLPPVGARVQVLEVDLPRQEFLEAWGLREAEMSNQKQMK